MEGLIIALIIGIVSSILNGKSKKDTSKKPSPVKPFMPQKSMDTTVSPTIPPATSSRSQRPKLDAQIKSLEDFTREVLGQLSAQQPKEQARPQEIVEAVVDKVEEAVPYVREAMTRDDEVVMRIEQTQPTKPAFQMASSKQELRRAIIMAEVLGKPKAKRRSSI